MLRSKTPSSQGLRSSAGKQNAQEEHDRPLFRTYRPAPSAHSTHLQIRPDPGSSIPFAPVNRAKFRKDHTKANDNAALDRLLATEFQSGRESVSLDPAGEGGILNGAKGLGPVVLPPLGGAGRKSFDTGGRPGSGLGRQGSGRRQSNDQGGRDRSQMGPLARNLSEKLGVRSDSTGLITGMKDREGPFRATKRRLGSARRNPQGGPSRQGNAQGGDYDEEEEELSSRALGVYIDGEGRLHDKEYDPFEKVRSLSRRKVEKRRVFGAAREDESEVGSDLSGSGVGFAGFDTGRQQRNQGKAGGTYQQQQDQQGDEWDDAQREQEEVKGNRTRSNTLNWSEYDSGISATSPRPVPIGESEFGDPTSPTRKSMGNYDPLSPMTATSSQPSSSQYVQRHASTSTRAGSTKTTQKRLEERPRSLLFPATPAQVAAQKIKERNTPQRVGTGSKSQSQAHHGHPHQMTQTTRRNHRVDDVVIEEEQLRPPVAPFNPMYGGEKRGKSPASSIKSGKARQHRDSADHTYAYGHQGGAGRRPSTQSQPHHHQHHQHHLQDGVSGVQHASSSVFSAGDMGYLPSRWARGEREFRAGEEELDKYRPMEFRGTREDQQDPEWRPGTMDQIKRNWHEISLAFRFGTHRAKKKVERKVRNM